MGTETGYLLIGILPGGVMRAYFEELRLLLFSEPAEKLAIAQVGAKYDVISREQLPDHLFQGGEHGGIPLSKHTKLELTETRLPSDQ